MAGPQAAAGSPDLGDVHAVPYAGIVTRAIALVWDFLLAQVAALIGFGALLLILTVVSSVHFSALGQLITGAGWTVVVGIYFVVFWTLTGQTPGMQLMRVRVVDAAGRPPRFLRSVVRVIGLALCIIPLFLGFVTVLFDARRRGLHDMLAGTTVVYAD